MHHIVICAFHVRQAASADQQRILPYKIAQQAMSKRGIQTTIDIST
jgi:hypothetical protein